MTFLVEPDTGVLRLSNKRRQGMKLSYQLNVSVSDGVFTNTAQVRQFHSFCALGLLVDLDFQNICQRNPHDLFLVGPRFRSDTHIRSCQALLAAELICSLELMCIYVILDLL